MLVRDGETHDASRPEVKAKLRELFPLRVEGEVIPDLKQGNVQVLTDKVIGRQFHKMLGSGGITNHKM